MVSNPSEALHNSAKRINVAIFQHTKLNIGAGEEKAILNYVKNVPIDSVSLTVYQTDYCPKSNLSDSQVAHYISNANLVTIKSILSRFHLEEVIEKSTNPILSVTAKAFYLFLKVFLSSPFNTIANRKTIQKFMKDDVAFIYDAEYISIIPRNPRRVPVVATFRRDFGPNFRKNTLRKSILYIAYMFIVRRAKRFHFLTQRLYDNSPIHRIGDFVLNSGTDIDEYYPEPESRKGPIKFILVARLEKVKGVAEAIESFENLGEVDAEFHIAGSGPLEEYVRSKAKSNPRIFYEGYLGKDELASLYRECDVLFFPTKLSEQHPLIVVEAVASGLKVITSEILRGIFDFFEAEGVLDYVGTDIETLSQKLRQCIKEKDALRQNSLKYAKKAENYDWKKISERLYSHLLEIAEECGV